MKRCSQCNRTYPDDNLNFCLSDGMPLVPVFDTLEEATVIKPVPLVQQPARQGVNPMFAYLAIGVLALLIGGAVVMWIKSDSGALTVKGETPVNTSNSFASNSNEDELNGQKASLREQQMVIEKEKQKLELERKKLEAQKDKFAQSPSFNQTISGAQPTARIKFHRGSVQETISGNIGTERKFVLRTRNGQYLSANVGSSNGCVVFGNGSTNTSYTTNSGDNYLSLVNNCGADSSFNLTVYIR